MQLAEIEACVVEERSLAQALDELGTLLRDEETRLLPQVRVIVERIIGFAELEQERLRVLVNYTADNAVNCRDLLRFDEFWRHSFKSGQNERLVILVTQFLCVEEVTKEAIVHFSTLGLANFLEKQDPFPFECASLLAEHAPESIDVDFVKALLGKLDEDFDGGSVVFAHLCTQNTFELPLDVATVLFERLEQASETSAKRRLFGACGFVTVASAAYRDFLIERLSRDDPYVVAACAIALGNLVTDKETQVQLVKALPRGFASRLINYPFGDVVQYQMLHLFNNIMTPEIGEEARGGLMRTTRVISDNAQVYKEVALLYCKFVGKLLASTDCVLDVGVWDYVQGGDLKHEINVQLVLAHLKKKLPFTEAQRVWLDSVATLPVTAEKLTAAALFVKDGHSRNYRDFLALLNPILAETAANMAQLPPLAANNAKFLAALLLNEAHGTDTEPHCRTILHTA